MNYHKIEKTSIANGTGVRVVLWCSGCSLHCEECHNPETWDFAGGKPFDNAARQELFEALDKPYIKGITFSGGHPLEPQNINTVNSLISDIKQQLPEKDIWLYTGFRLTDKNFIDQENHLFNVISLCDIVVDGAFEKDKKDLRLKWRGSTNQRVIDVKETIKQGKITEIKES